jgi:hypothetical protein
MAKHPGGRPTKYNPQFHPLLAEAYGKNGLIDTEIAEKLKITEQTLNNWKKVHPEFFESLKKGKNEIDDQVENAFLRRALGFERKAVKFIKCDEEIYEVEYNEYYPSDVAAGFIWLKNRRPKKWRDRKDIKFKDSTGLGTAIAAAFERRKNGVKQGEKNPDNTNSTNV